MGLKVLFYLLITIISISAGMYICEVRGNSAAETKDRNINRKIYIQILQRPENQPGVQLEDLNYSKKILHKENCGLFHYQEIPVIMKEGKNFGNVKLLLLSDKEALFQKGEELKWIPIEK